MELIYHLFQVLLTKESLKSDSQIGSVTIFNTFGLCKARTKTWKGKGGHGNYPQCCNFKQIRHKGVDVEKKDDQGCFI